MKNQNLYWQTKIFNQKIDPIIIIADEDKIHYMNFVQLQAGEERDICLETKWKKNLLQGETSLIEEGMRQLEEYFSGKRKAFNLPLNIVGTDFQKKVWKALLTIPYGETWSYKQLAQKVNNPKGYRAVGGANGANRFSIVIPCHRVVASQGGLGGYSGGLNNKKFLLLLEKNGNK